MVKILNEKTIRKRILEYMAKQKSIESIPWIQQQIIQEEEEVDTVKMTEIIQELVEEGFLTLPDKYSPVVKKKHISPEKLQELLEEEEEDNT